ncbi:MAG: hypothetical protein RIS75_286 [Actinomycetota bacterium]|jgi:uncharacterized Tic20 family protein
MSNEMPPPPPPIFDGGSSTPASSNESTWIAVAHFGTLANLIGLPGFLAPLIVMLTEGKRSANVRAHAVESLNFQLSILIYFIASIVLMFVLIGFVTVVVVGVLALVMPIIAGVKGNNGELYKYPLTIRMVK